MGDLQRRRWSLVLLTTAWVVAAGGCTVSTVDPESVAPARAAPTYGHIDTVRTKPAIVPRVAFETIPPAPTPPAPAPPILPVDDSNLSMGTLLEVASKRREITKFIWGDEGLPTTKLPATVELDVENPVASVEIKNLARVDRLTFDMGSGVFNEAWHFVPRTPNGRLVIVQQGHIDTFDEAGISETIAGLVKDGYGVLGALMVCLSSFPCPITPVDTYSQHNDLMNQVVVPPGEGSALKFFLDHLPRSLAYLRLMSQRDRFPAYTEYDMTGVSGGGWTTVLYSAVDPTIRISIPVSGSKPMYLRHCDPWPGCVDGYEGDREQAFVPFYRMAGYLDLYALGAAGAGRRQIQVQIRRDACCFGEYDYDGLSGVPGFTWEQAVRAYEGKLQAFLASDSDRGWFRFEIDETAADTHQISMTTRAQVILAELEGDRRLFGAASAADVFVKGPDAALLHNPPSWSPLPSSVVGAPAVPNGSEIFVRDASSHLVELLATPEGWVANSWADAIASDPAAAMRGEGVDVVAVTPASTLGHWYIDADGAVASEPTDPYIDVVGTPALVATGADRLDAFVRRSQGGLLHFWREGDDEWTSEPVTSETFRGFPSAVVAPDGSLLVFVRGNDDNLWLATQPNGEGAWNLTSVAAAAGAPDAVIAGSPSATVDASGMGVLVVGRSPSGNLERFERAFDNRWSHRTIEKPRSLSADALGLTYSPLAVPDGVFARDSRGRVWLDTPTAGWSMDSGIVY